MKAEIILTYFIHARWVKNLSTSILAFDIAQFFLFFNHQLLLLILNKTMVDSKISQFFWNYLVSRKN